MAKQNRENEVEVLNDTSAVVKESAEQKVSKEAKSSKIDKNIPAEVLACIGQKFIINEVTKTASKLGSQVFDIAYENAVMSHGSKNVRAFLCTEDNVAELNVILQKYKNGIIKA